MDGREVLKMKLGMYGVMMFLKSGFLKRYKLYPCDERHGPQRRSLWREESLLGDQINIIMKRQMLQKEDHSYERSPIVSLRINVEEVNA